MSEHGHNHSHSQDNHGHGHSHSPPPETTFDSQSLYSRIYHDQIWTMNESEPNAGRNVVKSWDERYDTEKILESDADEQLIMYIPFTGLVKLYSVLIRSLPDAHAPKTVKLFKNRSDIDFSIATDLKADAIIEHPAGIPDIVEYPLKRAIFSNVKSICLFVLDNHGEDTTQITYIGFRGEWKELSKDPVITIYEAAANPSDHKSLVPDERFVSG
ncbi:galactose-binding domain-like protein [Lipomyces tetrasporus]|uniref:Galactose-binding domain-like protein n=1 Tax=Lipomyces tetrasporus TaxID=54092 RepID=A0AAD7QV44_9ASCO|nr:galactose-binding domain-like protein [Lipomyces tetrasporus]KAJ8101898.1 galactose-binding domain-like protein [Lipomyces tetrasporus]